jgi:hypothetical protein
MNTMSSRESLVCIFLVVVVTSVSGLAESTRRPSLRPIQSVSQRAALTASDGQQYSFVGTSVAVSGNTIVSGAPGIADGQGDVVPGAVYVYVKPAGGWQNMTQVAELTASDGGSCPSCGFGASVAVSGNTIVVGSSLAKVYVYVEPHGGWVNMTETATLQAPSGPCLCGQVAIDENAIVVGSPLDASNYGSIQVYVKPAAGWQNTSQPNATLTESVQGLEDQMGSTVALSGNTVVSQGIVGTQNLRGVFVFVEPAGGWSGDLTETATLTSTQQYASPFSVSVAGDTVVAGSPDPYQTTPFVDVWVKPASGWTDATETAQLTDDTSQPDSFGWAVVILGNTVISGTPSGKVGKNRYRGAAYVFVKPASGWQTTSNPNAVLVVSNWTDNDGFGSSIAASGGTAVVGAPYWPMGNDIGAAYVFQK